MTDQLLVNRIAQGDQNALKQAFDKYHQMIFSLAMSIVHSEDLANDITQDTFIKLWQNAKKLDLKKNKLSTWLYKVALNQAINQYRKNSKKIAFEDVSKFTRTTDDGAIEIQIEDIWNINPQKYVENKEIISILKKTIDKLPKKQRIALTLKLFHNFSTKDIAEIMELKPNHVDVLIHRAKKTLQKQIIKLLK